MERSEIMTTNEPRPPRLIVLLCVAATSAMSQSCGENVMASSSPPPAVAQAQAQEAVPQGSQGELRRATALDDGIRSESHVALSRVLVDPETQEHVRCLSIAITFVGPDGEYLARLSGLETFEFDSERTITFDQGGIAPRSAGDSAPGHTYTIAISPPIDTVWGEAASSEVTVDVFRKH